MALSSWKDRQYNMQFQIKQSEPLNPSKEIRTGCPVTLKYGRTHQNKHEGVGRQQHNNNQITKIRLITQQMIIYQLTNAQS